VVLVLSTGEVLSKTIYVNYDLVKELKEIALERGTTLQVICNQAVNQ